MCMNTGKYLLGWWFVVVIIRYSNIHTVLTHFTSIYTVDTAFHVQL